MNFKDPIGFLSRFLLMSCFFYLFASTEAVSSSEVPGPNSQNALPKFKASHQWIGASVSERSLWIWDDVIAAEFGEKIKLWYGWQHSVAKGSSTGRFKNTAHRYGVKIAPFNINHSPLSFKYQAYRIGEGVATSENSRAVFGGPKVDQFDVWYKWGGLHFGNVSIPVYSAQVLGIKGSYPVELSKTLSAEFKGAVFYEWSPNVPGFKRRFNGVAIGGLIHRPNAFVETGFRLYLAPAGLPVEGTPLTSITAYQIYGTGGIIGAMKNRPVAFLSLMLAIKTP